MNALFDQIWAKKSVFLGTFFLVFTLTYILLVAVDFIPEPPAETTMETEEATEVVSVTPRAQAEETAEAEVEEVVEEIDEPEVAPAVSSESISVEGVLPMRLVIDRLEKDVTVLNPTSRTIADLDASLLEGVVRHPDSATLAQEGTVFILGHSSYLPQVFNKNFQAFNGIQNLEWGDKIKLYSEDGMYEYRVEKVYRARAQDVTVPIAGTSKTLTLATCNSFGSVDDRYIVEAKLVDVQAL
ncbi:MAG: sortase [Candidatus Kaiserbacteria bacterium]|nr:sortase [Candidatus Kaiserbacteria bacterium]MCB9816244.1 sortase [Candidatus Nomurabacteria bacterium]